MKLLEKNKAVIGKYNKIIVGFYIAYLLLVFADFMFINITDAKYCQCKHLAIKRFLIWS